MKESKSTHYSNDTVNFFESVYQVVKLIPRGRVTSYGAIAKALGTKGSSRIVGWAMNACHSQKEKIPAHRVVNHAGLLTGKHHFGDIMAMQRLLEKEGIKVKNDKVIDFEKIFWDPMNELSQ